MMRTSIAFFALSVSRLVAGPSITLPLAFEQNTGQTDPQVKYLTRGSGGTLWLTEQGPVLGVTNQSRLAVLRMHFEGAKRSPKIEGVNRTGGMSNYFLGNDPAQWRTDVPQFQQVRYRDVYPGIDVVFYGNDRKLEYDFVMKPGADPSRIRLKFDGGGALRKDSSGDVVLRIGDIEIRNHKPVVRQGDRIVDGEYQLTGDRSARFIVGAYDHGGALVIDPVMTYGTLLGGAGGDQASGVARDTQGNLYVIGSTTSTNFPVQNALYSSLNSILNPPLHPFVVKINPSASGRASVVFSTLFGGSGNDQGYAIGVDGNGNISIAGTTHSTDLPLKNAFNSVFPNDMSCYDTVTLQPGLCMEGFVAKLTPTGNGLVYSSYLGKSGGTQPNVLAMDASGDSWIAGATSDAIFPVSATAFQNFASGIRSGADEGFVSEISPAGALTYSTYFAAEALVDIQAIAVDAAGNVCIGGVTDSLQIPTTPGAFQAINPSSSPAQMLTGFVAKLNPNIGGAAGLLYGTYLGGTAFDNAAGGGVTTIAADASGNVYAGGFTSSHDFPVTASAARTTYTDILGFGGGEGFATKLNPAASGNAQLVYSTFFGGSADDSVTGLRVDSSGRMVIVGTTDSGDLQTTPDAFQCCFSGYITPTYVTQYGFVARLDPSKPGPASLLYSSYLGGTGFTQLISLALDSTGNNVVIGGYIESPDTPVTPSAFQSRFAGDDPNGGAPWDIGDAYIVNFNFATVGALISKYENGGGLSAISSPTIAPGLVFTLKGTFPGPTTSSLSQIDPTTGRLATNLEGVEVLVDGTPCPLTYVSTTQINAIAPYEIAGTSNPIASIQVLYQGIVGNVLAAPIASTAPGILSFDDGTGQGAILNQDGSINGAQNAASRGTIVTIFATGEGQTNPPGIDGALATNLNNLPHPVASVSVTIGGLPATNIAYAGTAPDEVYGLLQIDVTVPAGVTPGPSVPVVLTVGGVSSQQGLTMALK